MIREWNEATIKRLLKENRGQGTGKQYKPWLQVQDIASKGRSTRIFGQTTQRVHHFLSDLQLHYFYLLEFDDQVIDIREQFPLLDFYEQEIPLDEKLSKKLFNTKTQVPHIFTVPFLITKQTADNDVLYQARMIKQSQTLEKKATQERLELQRRYFEQKGIDFGIVTENEIDKRAARNIGWAMAAYDIQDYPELSNQYDLLKSALLDYLTYSQETFDKIFTRIEKEFGLNAGLGLVLFKHLLAIKVVKMDMSKRIHLSKQLDDYHVQVVINNVGGDRDAVGH